MNDIFVSTKSFNYSMATMLDFFHIGTINLFENRWQNVKFLLIFKFMSAVKMHN